MSELLSAGVDRPGVLFILLLAGSLAACSEPVAVPETELVVSWFSERAEDAGIDFRHAGGGAGTYATPENIGSGGAVFDYDRDGDLDVYLVDIAPSSEARENRLFRQEANGRFVDVTAGSGLGDRGYGMGAVFGDVDNDGDDDVFVTNLGPDALYLNNGDGTFRSGSPVGLEADLWSTSACFLDYDRDGRLDLYVATYLQFDARKSCTDSAGNPEFCGPEAFRGIPDRLFRGLGDGSLADVSDQALPVRPANKALGVICADLDKDGFQDVYVANDGEENQLWLNRGDGTFGEQALLSGAALNMFGKPEASMGVAAGDLDGDLDLDLFMTHLDRETNTYYANLGDATFEDRTPATGLGPASMPHTGFGTVLFDADQDGDLDLALVNGRVRRGASLSERKKRRRSVVKEPTVPPIFDEYIESNLFFLNDGGGSFEDASSEVGWADEPAAVSRGLLVDDFDLDGDLDLLVTNCGSRANLYRNDLPDQGHWLVVEAVDEMSHRDALGASVEIEAGTKRQLQQISSTQGYLAAARPRAHFGLADSTRIERAVVEWPGAARTEFLDMPVDRVIRVFGRVGIEGETR